MAWAGVKPAGAAGQWEANAPADPFQRHVTRLIATCGCGLCEQAHVSVLVMVIMPEVLIVTMMMAIVLVVIAAHPAVGVEHS